LLAGILWTSSHLALGGHGTQRRAPQPAHFGLSHFGWIITPIVCTDLVHERWLAA